MVSALTLLTEMLVSILRSGREVPVTTISSCSAPVSTVAVGPVTAVGAAVCASAGTPAKIAVDASRATFRRIIFNSPGWPFFGSMTHIPPRAIVCKRICKRLR